MCKKSAPKPTVTPDILSLCVWQTSSNMSRIFTLLYDLTGARYFKGGIPTTTSHKKNVPQKHMLLHSMGSFLQCHGFIVFLGHRCCSVYAVAKKEKQIDAWENGLLCARHRYSIVVPRKQLYSRGAYSMLLKNPSRYVGTYSPYNLIWHLLSNVLFFSFPVPAYEVVKIHSARQVLRTRRKKRSSPFSSPIGEKGEEAWVPQTPYQEVHRVRVNTHGREFQLELEPNPHLLTSRQGGIRRLDAWYADGYKTNVTYSPGPKVRTSDIWESV